MKFGVFITVEGRDRHGQLTFFEKKEANSFVRALIDLWFPFLQQATFTSGSVDITGATKSPSASTGNFTMNAAAGDVTKGIVVGKGTGSTTISTYKLVTLIAHGSAPDLLAYSAMTIDRPTTSDPTRSFTMERTLTNNSGGQITIEELGLYTIIGAGSVTHCIDRTVYHYVLNNLATVTFRYTVSLTV